MSLDSSHLDHLANLARMAIAPIEKDKLARELGSILTYFEKLKQLDTAEVSPVSQSINLKNIFRNDEVKEASPSVQDRLIASAPSQSGRYFKVGKIL